ncbi:TPA: hypothetical protein DEO28_04525 [Candidatus Dependentiae bacterium]|nr:MAG: hypothetical protein UR14_C0002G0023 [candidate division TM6 bacterium GW2011_GWE2_31_21]KKP53820.1 MAG: hypothetical protein UR43_C0002G0023 [candidate division TM6 bacterium GW2011_GWF2_33_332]HBS47600.1 hypothetical protein [Candidatus Dependentiae bacterium]HBZ73749.1 hypothetical protein [Candidatus Dependentiae bacterium]
MFKKIVLILIFGGMAISCNLNAGLSGSKDANPVSSEDNSVRLDDALARSGIIDSLCDSIRSGGENFGHTFGANLFIRSTNRYIEKLKTGDFDEEGKSFLLYESFHKLEQIYDFLIKKEDYFYMYLIAKEEQVRLANMLFYEVLISSKYKAQAERMITEINSQLIV